MIFFKDWANWTEEKKDMLESFIPSINACNDANEWRSTEELEDLGMEVADDYFCLVVGVLIWTIRR